ncbi:ABC transporter ATP-binding protein [Gammaproteobacteria bacterium AS21]|jgi:iron(III) transport system ATP-binding protein
MNSVEQTTPALLSLDNIDISYSDHLVVKNVSIDLLPGEIGCLLGPSGCGKSTLLRAIAGFEPVRKGTISLCEQIISQSNNTLVPEYRNIGMVFQDIALFPHLTIEKNIAFGLRKLDKEQQIFRVKQLLALVGLSDKLDHYPHQLSGGQQQRIALARALAPKPKLILLDEPFSGLDAKLRDTLVPQVRDILKQEQVSAIIVSHDQSEAFAIADKIAVMQHGQIHQWDNAYNIYHHPQTKFVASFIGKSKFLPATTTCENCIDTSIGNLRSSSPHGYSTGTEVVVLVRVDDLKHNPNSSHYGTVIKKEFHGSYFTFELVLDDGCGVLCSTPAHYQHKHAIGDAFHFDLAIEHLVLFDR